MYVHMYTLVICQRGPSNPVSLGSELNDEAGVVNADRLRSEELSSSRQELWTVDQLLVSSEGLILFLF